MTERVKYVNGALFFVIDVIQGSGPNGRIELGLIAS